MDQKLAIKKGAITDLVEIPPMIWYGFKGIGNYPAILDNCSDIPYDPSESLQVDVNKKVIGYDW